MRLLALLALAVVLVTCGCVVYECPSTSSTPGVLKLDANSDYIEVNCPPTDTHFVGTCTDGCNTWTCDGSGTCSVTSLYCPKEEAVDHAMSAYEWISAEEKLPNNGRDVLACLDLMRHWDTDGQSTVIAVMSYQPDTGRWYGDIDERGYTSFVTHWMDLPLPPVGEEA